jgi:FkbM family methyltransferase
MKILKGRTNHGSFNFWDGDWLGAKTAAGEFLDGYLLPYMNRLGVGQVMVDVGAHIGTFSIYLAHRGVHVKAFEASPEVFELLEMNIVENGHQKMIEAYNIALYDRDIDLMVSPNCAYRRLEDGRCDYSSTDCSGWLWLQPGTSDVYDIKARSLDSFGIKDVAFIKVDAEGCDLPVLRGAKETIKEFRPIVSYEFNRLPAQSNGYGLKELTEFMKAFQYEVIEVKSHGEDNKDFVAVPK